MYAVNEKERERYMYHYEKNGNLNENYKNILENILDGTEDFPSKWAAMQAHISSNSSSRFFTHSRIHSFILHWYCDFSMYDDCQIVTIVDSCFTILLFALRSIQYQIDTIIVFYALLPPLHFLLYSFGFFFAVSLCFFSLSVSIISFRIFSVSHGNFLRYPFL